MRKFPLLKRRSVSDGIAYLSFVLACNSSAVLQELMEALSEDYVRPRLSDQVVSTDGKYNAEEALLRVLKSSFGASSLAQAGVVLHPTKRNLFSWLLASSAAELRRTKDESLERLERKLQSALARLDKNTMLEGTTHAQSLYALIQELAAKENDEVLTQTVSKVAYSRMKMC